MPSGNGAPEARRTRATVMFADLVGFTEMTEKLGVETAYGAVTGCLRLLDGIARKHGGSVDKYQGDSLMVVFGYPVPMEEASRAALCAALEMRQRVYDYNQELNLALPLDVHIGVNTGALVAGDISGPVVREFHVLGDTVNISARIKAKSPLGSIYVGPESYDENSDRFEFKTLEPLQLKGKSKRVATYELLEAREPLFGDVLGEQERTFSVFVGRAGERQTLRQRIAALGEGSGGLVTLTGEEGSGKTRLLAELTPEATDLHVLQLRPPSTGERRPRQMAQAIGQALGETLLPDEALAAALEQPLVAAAAERPLLLVVEDLQRIGAESLSCLAELLPLAAGHPILFVALGRPEAGASFTALARAAREHELHLEEIALAPFDAEESRRLIDAVAGETLPAEARALIESRAAGNPARIILAVFLAPALGSESQHAAEQAERSSEAERRRATILFADITGFTAMTEALGPERAYPIVAGCLQLLDEVSRRHGGTVDKYLGDCVMALFGVPEAIEDAPRAAVNAAIEMRRRVREYNEQNDLPLPLDVHTGIHTGQSIAGDISGPLIREFAVMGEPVVVANELTDAAEAGEIFVGPETWQLTRERFDFEERPPVEIPGREGGVVAYELRSQTEQLYRRRATAEREIFSELVGRDDEMVRLQERVNGLAEGSGGFVTLAAEAGLGKSRLVEELEKRVAGQVTWLEGRSLSTGSQLSFHPFADLLRSWVGVDDDDDEEGIAAKLEASIAALLPNEVEDAFPFLATVMGARLTPEQRERLESVQGELLDRAIRGRVFQILQRLAEQQPLVLLFDDLHWADLSSIELLETVQRLAATHPVLFVHVFRPHFAATSERVLDFLREQHAERLDEIELRPLGAEAIRLLINNLFRHADIPQRVRARIVEKASGNPFFVEEVVRSFIEEGAVVREGDGFRPTEKIHSAEVPGTVQEVVMSRIDRLPLRQRDVVHAASVIGRSFHFEVLRQVLPEKDILTDDLELLREGGFVVPWDRLQGVEYAFKHPLIQEVAYDSLLEARREELHLAVGGAIEASLTDNVPGYHAMLAYHFSKGRDLARAEESLFAAGDEAARSAASNEALSFFQEASKLYVEAHPDGGDPAKRARLEKNVGLALGNRGQLIEAEEHLNAALRLLGETVPKNQLQLGLRFVGNLAKVMSRLFLRSSGERRAATDVDREVIELMMKRAEAQTYVSPTRFVFDSIDTLNRIDQVEPRTVPGSGGYYAGAVGIFTYGGLSQAVSRRFLAQAEPLVRPDDVRERAFYAAMNHMHHFFAGDWSEAQQMPDSLLEEATGGMQLWSAITYLQLLAEQHIRRGDFDRARESLGRIDAIWETYDYDYAKTNHYWLPTLLALEQRKLPEAVRAAEAYYDEIPEDLLHILALSAKTHAAVHQGDLELAGETLERATKLVKAAGFPPVYQASTFQSARFAYDLARLEEALASGDAGALRVRRRAAARSSRAALGAVAKVAYRQPEVFRLEGRRRWLAGQHDKAFGWWERSLAMCEQLGLRPERARTARELARYLAEPGAPPAWQDRTAAAWRSEAHDGFRQLGLDGELAALEADPTA